MAPSSPSTSGSSTPALGQHGTAGSSSANGIPAPASGSNLAALNPADPLGAAAPDGRPHGHSSPGNTVQLHQLVTGCKVWVERPAPEEPRKAEILSIRATRQPRPPRNKDGTRPKLTDEQLRPTTEYYVHYVEFNKVSRASVVTWFLYFLPVKPQVTHKTCLCICMYRAEARLANLAPMISKKKLKKY